jgi:hypothetical protein
MVKIKIYVPVSILCLVEFYHFLFRLRLRKETNLYGKHEFYKRSNIQSNKKTHYNKKYLYYLVKPDVFFFVFIIIIKKYSYHVF